MKKTLFISFLLMFSIINPCFGEIIYVDNQLSGGCTTYDPSAGRGDSACGSGSSRAFVKIQDAIYNMSVGDTIYIRGGRYHEVNSYDSSMIDIPTTLSGDSWEDGHYNTLASYPGEWAIIDGEGTAPKGVVLGHKGMSSGEYGYWKFERLEITGGCRQGNDLGGAGLWLTRGPFIVRYCYIHDNFDDSNLDNPTGIAAYRLKDCIIEYNYFYRNGFSGNNGGTINMFPDYNDESQGQDDLVDIGRAQHGNHIRYNYFISGGSCGGIKMKGSQMLGPNIAKDADGGGWQRQELGDKIHHNIWVDYSSYGVNIRQDFAQVYNNIFIGCSISSSEYNQYGRRRQCFYNNTIIGGGFIHRNKETPTVWVPPAYYSEDYVYNNIFDNFVSGTGYMSYPIVYRPDASSSYVSTINSVFDRGAFRKNYIYRPGRSGDMISVASGRIGEDAHFGRFTVAEYDAMFATSNYFKLSSEGSDNIMAGTTGADQYIPRAEHVVEGESTTVSNGGVGDNHPYLLGVTIPSYLGATNPEDNAWVAGVLSLANVSTLQNGRSSDPGWIEGGSGSSQQQIEDTTSPYTSGHNPARGATDVSISSNIVCNILDAGDGVDQGSIIMTVNGETISPTITGSFSNYTVTYDPATDFNLSSVISVTISAQDLAGNVMNTDSWSFTTQTQLTTIETATVINAGDSWNYFKGTADPGTGWNDTEFNDSNWMEGPTGIGYGDDDDATILSDMLGNYMTVYARKTFDVTDASSVTKADLNMIYDDGFIAYINGVEVARANMSGTPDYNTPASDWTEPGSPQTFDLSSSLNALQSGTNVLSIEVHNAGVDSSDLSLIPELVITQEVVAGSPPSTPDITDISIN